MKKYAKMYEDGKGLTVIPSEKRTVNGFVGDAMAFDKGSVRTIDQDGRMHVALTHISKANVCPYNGNEIPDYEKLGLDPEKVYQLYRDPDELKKAAASANNIPLLDEHIPVSTDDHRPDSVVGSTGSDAVFNDPYLDQSLVVWTKDAIRGIENRRQQEISCAYYYTADMTPGTFQGQDYDGVMRNIRFNHVALVEKGRAGPDVMVSDSFKLFGVNIMGKALSKTAIMAQGALLAVLPRIMAKDAKFDLGKLFPSLTKKNFGVQKANIAAAIKPKLAKDADMDQVIELLDKLEEAAPDDDVLMDKEKEMKVEGMDDEDMGAMDDVGEKICAMLEGKVSPEEMEEIKAMLSKPKAMDEPVKTEGAATNDPKSTINKKEIPDGEGKMDKAAMDKAIKLACDATAKRVSQEVEKSTISRLRAIAEAEEIAKPYVGKLAAMDSADQVYKTALNMLKIDIDGVHPSAYRAILKTQAKPGENNKRAIAQDSVSDSISGLHEAFPDLYRVK